MNINYRKPLIGDIRQLSVLYKQVYIQTYGVEGVSQEFADFIIHEFSEQRIEEKLADPNHLFFIAEHKGNPVGVLEVVFGRSSPLTKTVSPEINKLYILERFCHLGIGSQLMQLAEDELRTLGYQHVWLWVFIKNNRAINFYQKHRYDCIGTSWFQMSDNQYENKVMTKAL